LRRALSKAEPYARARARRRARVCIWREARGVRPHSRGQPRGAAPRRRAAEDPAQHRSLHANWRSPRSSSSWRAAAFAPARKAMLGFAEPGVLRPCSSRTPRVSLRAGRIGRTQFSISMWSGDLMQPERGASHRAVRALCHSSDAYAIFWKASAARNTVPSSQCRPTSIMPTGNPADLPAGTVMAGWPVTSNGQVLEIISSALAT
jgi:hypothetical protein